MSSLPKFEYEVFISYAHLDNKPLLDAEKGWVTQFDELLDNLLGQFLGSDPNIWRDNTLRGDDFITDAILMQMPRIAVMVSVLSPRYIKSEWCLREVQEFCKAAQQTGGFRLGNKSRVYKVVKTPIKSGEPPEIFKDIKGYEFFQYKDKDGKPQMFAAEFGPEAKKNFLDKVGDVAYDIASLIEVIREQANISRSSESAPAENGEEQGKATVYLAEATPDLVIEWGNVRRDLLQRNYRVLPDQPLPSARDELIKTVRADLQECSLSIHLVGEEYGACPEDDDKHSYAYLQNMLAVERETDPAFARLVWMPKGNKPEGVNQWKFVKELLEASPNGNSDLLQTSLEDFKTAIQDRLKGKKKAASKSAERMNASPLVYLICDKLDLETDGVRSLEMYLNGFGYETVLPAAQTDEANARKDHEDKLKACDAVIIYWHNAPRLWLLTKLDDLQKIRGYGRSKELLSKAIYVTGEATPEKERFRSLDALVIKNFGESTLLVLEEMLKSFIGEIERGRGGQVRENF